MNQAQPQPPLILSLADGVGFSTRKIGDQTSYVAFHAGLGKYYRFGAEEYFVAGLINGQRSATDLFLAQQAHGLGWSQDEILQFIRQLVSHRIVIAKVAETLASGRASSPPTNERAATSSHPSESIAGDRFAGDANAHSDNHQAGPSPSTPKPPSSAWSRATMMLSMIVSQRIPLASGQRVAETFAPLVSLLFSRRGLILWSLLTGSALLVVLGHREDFKDEMHKLFDPAIWPLLLGIWVVSKVVHEIGHAVAAACQGVRIGSLGVMFFLFAPLAYVDVTDAWKLANRFGRVQIALAGVYLELLVAALAAWGWWWLPDGLARHLAAQVCLVAGPATLLVNANPLLRLDGYYVLSDLLEIPNLRMHGRKALVSKLEYWLFNIPPEQSLLHGWRRTAATNHALASVAFQMVWMSGLVIAVCYWARGLGILIGCAAALLWGVIPLAKWTHKIWNLDPPERFGLNTKRQRLLTLASVLLMCVHFLSTTASPLARRVPVVVRFQNEQISRAITGAFVGAVYVEYGQRVGPGDLLIQLEHPEMYLEQRALVDDLQLAKQKAIQYRRLGKLALAEATQQEAESLKRRLEEIDQRVAGLRIVANRRGLVTTPNVQRLLGRYVHQGDELIRVSDPNEKELLVTVGESDMQAYQLAATPPRHVEVRLRGGKRIQAVPISLRPRAVHQLPHPALSALSGGPLAVTASDDPEHPLRLARPQLLAVAPLDPVISTSVAAGQLGTMTISDNRSLVARLYDAFQPTTP